MRFVDNLLISLKTTALTLTFMLQACTQETRNPQTEAKTERPPVVANRADKIQTHTQDSVWALGETLLNEAAVNAETLNTQIAQLLSHPSSEAMTQARTTWTKTAESIELFYVFSRLGLVEPTHFKYLLDMQYNTAAWPIHPGYLDTYGEHLYSGIIFDISSPIEEQTLRDQHGLTDSADATLGIYALGFLLFGEDNQRSHIMFKPLSALTDSQLEKGYQQLEELPRNRRRALLKEQAELLSHDIAKVRTLWSGKDPESMLLHFQQRSQESQEVLLSQAAQTMLTEQILSMAELQKQNTLKVPDNEIWQGQQLADRLSAQLLGLSFLAKETTTTSLQTLSESSKSCADNLKKINFSSASARAPGTVDKPKQAFWKEAYECTRQLIRVLAEAD